MRRATTIRALAVSAAACAILTLLPVAAPAGKRSLYGGPGHRPGPDLLYAKPVRAPQLANRGPWKAAPILVSGASAYRRGEFLYQDFLYDDHGAASGQRDPGDPRYPGHIFSQANGFYLYPDDPAYADNAADLVELRVKALRRATAFRITYNAMKDPSLVAATIAIGSSGVPRAYPHGGAVSGPAKLFLTVHGRQAELVTAAGGQTLTPAPKVRVSKRRRQVQVIVPRAAWDPGRRTVRLAMGTGLWDEASDRYLIPQQARTATAPGGAGELSDPPAFFNLAFRSAEPYPRITDVPATARGPAWWRDKLQGEALAAGDVSPFFARVSFAKLRRRVTDNRGVPKRGPLDRIFASRHEVAQGVDYDGACLAAADRCAGVYRGRLQPYAIYVPPGPRPRGGWGMTLLMHSLSTNYNQYSDSTNQRQFGERGKGSIVITPEARGPDGSYDSYALADVFEVWADVARRYRLDPAFTVATGYSMGGIGTFKIAQMYPDLFARAQPTVGAETTTHRLASLRNVPVLMWNGAGDELVSPPLYLPTAAALDDLGYRYELDVFSPGEHNSLAINDEFAPAARFLGTAKVNRNPHHVTYVVDPQLDERRLGIVASHAYWLSGLRVRGEGQATIDAISRGFGRGDPAVGETEPGGGALPGGAFLDPYPFTSQRIAWGRAPRAPQANRVVIEAENLAAATLNVRRARVGCDVRLAVTSDGPLRVRLAGCDRVVSAG